MGLVPATCCRGKLQGLVPSCVPTYKDTSACHKWVMNLQVTQCSCDLHLIIGSTEKCCPLKSSYSDPVRQGIFSNPPKVFNSYLKHQAGFPSHVQTLPTVNASRHKAELHLVFVVIMPVDNIQIGYLKKYNPAMNVNLSPQPNHQMIPS